MTRETSAERNRPSRRNPGEDLKDEVYRQMFRLEARRPGAAMSMASALLRAWVAYDADAKETERRPWPPTDDSPFRFCRKNDA
jgi:hypothetical protein